MASKEIPTMQFPWAAEGKADPFANYLDRSREDLPLAELTDDQLANYAFMNYARNAEDEVKVMIAGSGIGEYPKIAFMTAVKERLRWLSRQLALAQGVYPGQEEEIPELPLVPLSETYEEESTLGDKYPAGEIEDRLADQIDLPKEEVETPDPYLQRKSTLLWDNNIRHFLAIMEADLKDFSHFERFDEFIKGFSKRFGKGLEDINLQLALWCLPYENNHTPRERWYEYIKLIRRLLQRQNIYVPFDGDVIAKSANGGNAILTRSQWHASGQPVDHPEGTIEGLEVKLHTGGLDKQGVTSRDHGGGKDLESGRSAMLSFLDGLAGVEPLAEEESTSGKKPLEASPEWFAGMKELLPIIGIHPGVNKTTIVYSSRQVKARIRWLAPDLGTNLIEKAIDGAGEEVERLAAFVKVRDAVKAGIQKFQELHVDEQARVEAEKLESMKHTRLGVFTDFQEVSLVDTPPDVSKE